MNMKICVRRLYCPALLSLMHMRCQIVIALTCGAAESEHAPFEPLNDACIDVTWTTRRCMAFSGHLTLQSTNSSLSRILG